MKRTFNLPNLIDRTPLFSATLSHGYYGFGGLPNITGRFAFQDDDTYCIPEVSGAFRSENAYYRTIPGAPVVRGTFASHVVFDASLSSNVFSNDFRGVIPQFVTMYWVIKY